MSPTELGIKEKQVEIAEMQLDEAQNAVTDAEQAIADAQQTVADAQEELDEAKATSPVIKAPFAGLITGVNVSVGDVVRKGAVAVILADPSKFGATFMVGEMDILQVKLGGEAWVQVDAMPGMSLPATVTHISPIATIQSGVVSYRVKVEIESLEAVQQERQEAGREAMQGITQGELPERIRQAIEEGRITQEQVEEMMERMQQGQGGQQAMPTMPLEGFQLREGLTVTVSILVEERNDVLLVPNSAITSQGGQSYVHVVSPDGTTKERPVTTGLSDWQYTEVTSGLSEGEKIIVPQGTTITPTTPQQGGQGGVRIPGVGRPH
jgi:multidrug efflux pump subunit AcrA (membrane-fusion protein)